jgi:hypothetical protein
MVDRFGVPLYVGDHRLDFGIRESLTIGPKAQRERRIDLSFQIPDAEAKVCVLAHFSVNGEMPIPMTEVLIACALHINSYCDWVASHQD